MIAPTGGLSARNARPTNSVPGTRTGTEAKVRPAHSTAGASDHAGPATRHNGGTPPARARCGPAGSTQGRRSVRSWNRSAGRCQHHRPTYAVEELSRAAPSSGGLRRRHRLRTPSGHAHDVGHAMRHSPTSCELIRSAREVPSGEYTSRGTTTRGHGVQHLVLAAFVTSVIRHLRYRRGWCCGQYSDPRMAPARHGLPALVVPRH